VNNASCPRAARNMHTNMHTHMHTLMHTHNKYK